MNLFKNKILKIKKKKLGLALVLALIFIMVPKITYGFGITLEGIGDTLLVKIVGFFLDFFIKVAGIAMSFVMKGVISFSSYNTFIHEPVIQEAWNIVSSFCNMFFILIVLIIAFANILNIDSYRIKSTLPKVIIMAILINFSLMICGLLIDFSQIFMMTFVNAIGTSGGNYVEILKVRDYFETVTKADWSGNMDSVSAVIGMAMAFIFMVVGTITLFYVMMIIIMRIVMLWIYSILSPFAFLLSAFPAGKPYASKWWDRFTKELIAGPVLMFFVWLAFYTSSQMGNFSNLNSASGCTGPYKLFCPGSFLTFFMSIAMLIGGLKITQEIGGVTGGLAGGAMNRIQQGRRLMTKGAIGGALGVSAWTARKFKADGLKIGKKQLIGPGWELNPANIVRGVKEGLSNKKRKEEIRGEYQSAMALRGGGLRGLAKGLGASQDMTESMAQGLFYFRGLKKAKDTVKAKRLKDDRKKKSDILERTQDEGKKAELQSQIDDIDKKLEQTRTPFTFHADQKRGAAIREAQSQISEYDNEEQLVTLFNDAVDRNDQETASAVVLQAAKVGHLNELINRTKSKKDLKDYKYADIKKGDYLPEGGYGLNEFVNQRMVEDLGMNKQEAYATQSIASGLAKSVGHYNMAESIGVKNGVYYQRDHETQQELARNELAKKDREKTWRDMGRLAHGEEIQYEDKVTGKIKRRFVLNQLGKDTLKDTAKTLHEEIRARGRVNVNAIKNLVGEDGKGESTGLKKYLMDEMGDKVFKRTRDKDGKQIELTYKDLYDDIINFTSNMINKGDEQIAETQEDFEEKLNKTRDKLKNKEYENFIGNKKEVL